MAKCHHKSDALLLHSKLEVPSVEALMACPLSKYIHFTANNCNYQGSRYELIANWVHPLLLKAKSEASKEDNTNWKQAMNGPFKEEYGQAAVKEIETLESMNAWEVVDRRELSNIIDSIWAFKLKCYPDGMPKKFKTWFCMQGDKQLKGIDFIETYAPVVQWMTVWLMLILEILLDLKSKQGDVTAAFLHSELDENEKVYVEMPLSIRKQGKVEAKEDTIWTASKF